MDIFPHDGSLLGLVVCGFCSSFAFRRVLSLTNNHMGDSNKYEPHFESLQYGLYYLSVYIWALFVEPPHMCSSCCAGLYDLQPAPSLDWGVPPEPKAIHLDNGKENGNYYLGFRVYLNA